MYIYTERGVEGRTAGVDEYENTLFNFPHAAPPLGGGGCICMHAFGHVVNSCAVRVPSAMNIRTRAFDVESSYH